MPNWPRSTWPRDAPTGRIRLAVFAGAPGSRAGVESDRRPYGFPTGGRAAMAPVDGFGPVVRDPWGTPVAQLVAPTLLCIFDDLERTPEGDTILHRIINDAYGLLLKAHGLRAAKVFEGCERALVRLLVRGQADPERQEAAILAEIASLENLLADARTSLAMLRREASALAGTRPDGVGEIERVASVPGVLCLQMDSAETLWVRTERIVCTDPRDGAAYDLGTFAIVLSADGSLDIRGVDYDFDGAVHPQINERAVIKLTPRPTSSILWA